MRRALLLLLLALALPARARAEMGDAPAVAAAKRHAAEAEKLFSLGLFEQSADEYQKAFIARPIPAFLYNIGQCYRRMGGVANLEKAVFHFESYLHQLQTPAERERMQRRIDDVKRELQGLRVAQRTPVYKRWWFWTVIGVAVAGATTAAILATRPEDQRPVEGNGNPGLFNLPAR